MPMEDDKKEGEGQGTEGLHRRRRVGRKGAGQITGTEEDYGSLLNAEREEGSVCVQMGKFEAKFVSLVDRGERGGRDLQPRICHVPEGIQDRKKAQQTVDPDWRKERGRQAGSAHAPSSLQDCQNLTGQDRYGVMTRVYYKDAHAAIVVLDATRQRTTEGALRWKADLDAKVTLADGSPVPAVLLANKCDMENELTDEELENLEEENGFIASFRTSAKDNFGIDEAFRCVANKVLNTEKGGQYEVPFSNRDGNIRLSQASALHKTQSVSCCF
ncbi:hypothetical protein WR25_08338 [Diploscapter pachys]|uniref:Ras-related protein Rab n=1 Tax=Diploscapter pachys TaxID=2018661 RepID=A0A2A2JTL0_9BILA|nr:hypothetical protein WR25_08338 [Diploscapter pachys]